MATLNISIETYNNYIEECYKSNILSDNEKEHYLNELINYDYFDGKRK